MAGGVGDRDGGGQYGDGGLHDDVQATLVIPG